MKFPTNALQGSEVVVVERGSTLVRQLEMLLLRERDLHRDHAALVRQEQSAITKGNIADIRVISDKREQILEELQVIARARIECVRQFPGFRGKKLRELVAESCHPDDQKRLLPILEAMRNELIESQSLNADSANLAQFALGMVNGSIAILWSASNNVVRSYSKNGEMKEAVQPSQAGVHAISRTL